MRNQSPAWPRVANDSVPFAQHRDQHENEGSVVEAPRWLFLAALVFAPWAYGSTREWAVTGLCAFIGAIALLWMIACLLQRRWPAVPRLLGITTAILLAQGWFLVGNARYEYDPATLEFTPLNPVIPFAPGSLHQSLSFQGAMQSSAMLLALCLVCDMTRRAVWRKRLLWTIAFVGLSIVLLGLAQRFSNATAIFWGDEYMGRSFFGTFRYHSNAGAFLNLVWPVVAGFTVMSFLRDSPGWKKGLWLSALVICLAGAVVIASRAAAALAVVLAMLWGTWIFREIARGRWRGITITTAAVAGLVTVLLIGSLAALAGLDVSMKRWSKFEREITEKNPRLLTAQVCLDMIPEAGVWGFGPGTFQTAFPYFTHLQENQISGRWIYAHQDYLQTLIEWGYLGGIAWAVLIFGGLYRVLARAYRHRNRLSVATRVTRLVLVTGMLGVLLHSLVDFPLQIASIQLYAVVMVGMSWSSRRWMQPAQRPTLGRRAVTPAEPVVLAP